MHTKLTHDGVSLLNYASCMIGWLRTVDFGCELLIGSESQLDVYEIQRRTVCSSILTMFVVCVLRAYFEVGYALRVHLASGHCFYQILQSDGKRAGNEQVTSLMNENNF